MIFIVPLLAIVLFVATTSTPDTSFHMSPMSSFKPGRRNGKSNVRAGAGAKHSAKAGHVSAYARVTHVVHADAMASRGARHPRALQGDAALSATVDYLFKAP